jgi:hypothetical protein
MLICTRYVPLAPSHLGASRFYNLFPDDNSLSNLDTLRGVFGAHPRVRVRKTSLARYSLSMRKPCLESYILEMTRAPLRSIGNTLGVLPATSPDGPD